MIYPIVRMLVQEWEYEDVITHGVGAVMSCFHEGQGSYSSSRTEPLLYDQVFHGNL